MRLRWWWESNKEEEMEGLPGEEEEGTKCAVGDKTWQEIASGPYTLYHRL